MFASLTKRFTSAFSKEKSDQETKENGGASEAPLAVVVNDIARRTRLFDMLSPELLLLVFQYIGAEDKRSFVRLATCSDRELARFIYIECIYLWRDLDLSECSGISDSQLKSLLERINARSITRSIVLDKASSTTITGSGLEPLRGSKVLESIDLRQSLAYSRGPTSLDDELVSDILSTMIPHKLETVKVRKQYHRSTDFPLDEYCFPWSSFFAKFALEKSRSLGSRVCSHCDRSMSSAFRNGRITTQNVLTSYPLQCSSCQLYSCQSSSLNAYTRCPIIRECQQCLEWSCPCQGAVQMCNYCSRRNCPGCDPRPLTCHGCGNTSCSKCNRIIQCKKCLETSCHQCRDDLYTCVHCNESYCKDCIWGATCNVCSITICEACEMNISEPLYADCDWCAARVCNGCQADAYPSHPPISQCHRCTFGLCGDCCTGDIDERVEFTKCCYCQLPWCDDPECLESIGTHACKPPGELVYRARDSRKGDNESNLCACGKKHLSSSKGQQFMCAWVQK